MCNIDVKMRKIKYMRWEICIVSDSSTTLVNVPNEYICVY